MLTITRAIRGHEQAPLLLAEMEPTFPENVAVLRVCRAYASKDFPEARRALAVLCHVLRKSTWVDTTLLNPVLKMAEARSAWPFWAAGSLSLNMMNESMLKV